MGKGESRECLLTYRERAREPKFEAFTDRFDESGLDLKDALPASQTKCLWDKVETRRQGLVRVHKIYRYDRRGIARPPPCYCDPYITASTGCASCWEWRCRVPRALL